MLNYFKNYNQVLRKQSVMININRIQNIYYTQYHFSNHFIDLSFQGINRFVLLSFENGNGRTSQSEYCLPKVEIKDCNVKTDGKNVFD